MKSYEERLKYILERRDEQLRIKENRRRTVLRYSALAACFCVTVILGCQVFVRMETVNRSDLIKPVTSSDVNTLSGNTRITVKTTVNTTITHTTQSNETDKTNTAKTMPKQTRLPETQITDEPGPALTLTSSVPKITANNEKITTRITSSKKPATTRTTVNGSKTTARVSSVAPITTSVVLPDITDTKPINTIITITEPKNTTITSSYRTTGPVLNTTTSCVSTSAVTIDQRPLDYETITEEFSTFTFKNTVYHLSNELNSEQISQVSSPDSAVMGYLKLTGKTRSVNARILLMPNIPASEAVAVIFEKAGLKLGYCMYKPL